MADTTPAPAPIVGRGGEAPIAAVGRSLVIHEWTGSGPMAIHVHHADDEGWHVLAGALRFTFPEGTVDAPVGTTVFVPAGVPHTYREIAPSRYLIFLTPQLDRLIAALHTARSAAEIPAIMARYDSALVG